MLDDPYTYPLRPILFPYGPTTHRGNVKRGIGGSRELYRREIANPDFLKIYDVCTNQLAERINTIRVDSGYTLEDMAEMLGLSMQSFSDRIHKRTKFELAEIVFLSSFFHITIYDLLHSLNGDDN